MMRGRKAGWVQNLCCGAAAPSPNHGLCRPLFPVVSPKHLFRFAFCMWDDGLRTLNSALFSPSHTLSLIPRAFVFQFYRGRSKTPGLSKLGQSHKVNTHGSQDSNPGLSDFKVWARGPFIIPEVPTEMAELSGSWGLRKMINSARCKFMTVW